MLYQFFQANQILVYFVYGLVFFLTGFAIALQDRSFSNFRLARSLWILALFGILHGLAEWGIVFIPLQSHYLPETSVEILQLLQQVLIAISFTCLFYFGTILLSNTDQRYHRIRHLPLLLLGVWFVSLIIYLILHGDNLQLLLATSEVWIRYLLAFPGALLSSLALRIQLTQFQDLADTIAAKELLISSWVLALYALLAGLIVPGAPFFPASVINASSFFNLVGLPVPVFRAALGLALVYLVIHLLKIFKKEHNRRLEIAEGAQAILKERERIGRDLHDGTIQAIYAVGLSLENCRYLTGEKQDILRTEIDQILLRLNAIIKDVRGYITNLRPELVQRDIFQERFLKLINQFKKNSSIHSDVSIIRESSTELTTEQESHIYHLLQEALNNIIRHSKATTVKIRIMYGINSVEFMVSDNGRGFSTKGDFRGPSGEGLGLQNMSERVEIMGGELEISSTPGKGTEIKATIPYEVENI